MRAPSTGAKMNAVHWRMIEGRGSFRFPQKPLTHVFRKKGFHAGNLERHSPAQVAVFGQEYDPIPTPPQLADEFEPPDSLAGD